MAEEQNQFDIVFRNGRVVDGTGNPWVIKDVGVRGDRIAAVGGFPNAVPKREIDIAGKVLCPGFIDVHVHSELGILTGEAAEARIRQGVTTDFLAPDGLSYAPLSPARLAEIREYLAIFYGEPDIDWQWTSHTEYLERYDGKTALNVVPHVAFNALRAEVVGWEPRPATATELDRMKGLTREIMEDGAAGLQTGLEYYPSAHATLEELVELCKVVGEYGGVHSSHLRGYGLGFRESSAELFATAKQAGVPVHMSHLAGCRTFQPVLEEVRAEGLDVSFDAYPYMAGSTHLIYCFPAWVQYGAPHEALERLADASVRDKIRPEMNKFFVDRGFDLKDVVFSTVASDENQSLIGRSLAEAVEESGKDLTDFSCDLLVQERLRVLMIFHWEAEERLKVALTHPLHMMSSDGVFQRGRPHPRGYGAFARLLGHYVRERGWLTLEDAVRRATGFPAARYQLNDRGLIRPGMAADLVVFDPETIIDRATYEDGRRYAEGVEYVAVNGELVLDDGKITGAKPGRVVRVR